MLDVKKIQDTPSKLSSYMSITKQAAWLIWLFFRVAFPRLPILHTCILHIQLYQHKYLRTDKILSAISDRNNKALSRQPTFSCQLKVMHLDCI